MACDGIFFFLIKKISFAFPIHGKMKSISLIIALLAIAIQSFSQKKPVVEIEKLVTRNEVEAPLTFLAADAMRGRDTGSPELEIAANFIASRFQQLGLQVLSGAEHYFQAVDLVKSSVVVNAELKFKDDVFRFKDQFIILEGGSNWSGECVYVGYGSAEELPADLKGKMVVSMVGSKDSQGREIFVASNEKLERVKALGAAGLIEFFQTPPPFWLQLVNYYGGNARVSIQSDIAEVLHIWMSASSGAGLTELKERKTGMAALSIQGGAKKALPSKNVIGKIEGTDPILKNEHIVISAHYDHVGVGVKVDQDSIYNGARDNALGTVGMLTAASYFTKFPPKRSIIFMALTAEEKGLLGSEWYADHPLVPLRQTVFDFDCDGAGYNDKSVATVIGLERTSAESNISKACAAFGLAAGKDPVPEQNLYERSDNYNFAKKGVPAIDFATGIKSFDAEIQKYYHKPADEVATLDFDYLIKYYRAFVYANYLIANDPKTPFWNAGDKFEPVGKELYQK